MTLSLTDDLSGRDLTPGEVEKMKSPEAFKLELTPGSAAVYGRTRAGILRGVATLTLMANRARFKKEGSLPAMTLHDAPRMPWRGWFITDTTPLEALKQTIDTAFLLRLNKLFIPLDSYGKPTKFPFETLPIGVKNSGKKEWMDAFQYARERGIEPIPYFASWGRVQYLGNVPELKKYYVDDVVLRQKEYRNLDVANPESHHLMYDLQNEIIETLKPESFNIAMDETHYGNTVTSPAARAKGWKPSDWFTEAVNLNSAFLKKKNVKMYIWGDMLDPDFNGRFMDMSGAELLKRLPKELSILDCRYEGGFDHTSDFPSFKMFKEAGYPTIGCPWFRPNNIARIAYSIAKYHGDGMCPPPGTPRKSMPSRLN